MFASIVSYGLAVGAVYALIGITYNVMFSASRVFSFTAGMLGMLGGVLGALFINQLGMNALLAFILVLAAGANPNIADKDGASPLRHARKRNQREVAALIEAAPLELPKSLVQMEAQQLLQQAAAELQAKGLKLDKLPFDPSAFESSAKRRVALGLIIDELGFVPLSKTGAELLFETISLRYERGSTLITSNLPFDEWTETFGTERLTGALLDLSAALNTPALRFVLTNAARALVMGLTGSHWVRVPENVAPETRRYYQQLTRFSSAFALFADVSMLVMGGAIAVTVVAYQGVPRMRLRPLLAEQFEKRVTPLNKSTLLGAAIFGLGWGLSGMTRLDPSGRDSAASTAFSKYSSA